MNRLRLLPSGLLIAAFVVGGCQSSTRDMGLLDHPAPAVEKVGGAVGGLTATLKITSEPNDAMVVVNRQPVGITPRKIELPVTEQGYLAEQVTIAVRFVARDVEEASRTETITLYRTDRAPTELFFARERETVRSF